MACDVIVQNASVDMATHDRISSSSPSSDKVSDLYCCYSDISTQQQDVTPCRDKYKHLIGSFSGQEAAKITQPNKSFGYGGLPWILLFTPLTFDPI